MAIVVTRIEAITGASRTGSQLTSEQILYAASERLLSAVGPADAATVIYAPAADAGAAAPVHQLLSSPGRMPGGTRSVSGRAAARRPLAFCQ